MNLSQHPGECKKEELDQVRNNPYVQMLNWQKAAIHIVNRDLKIIFINTFFKQWMKDLDIPLPDDIEGLSIFKLFPFLDKGVRDEYRSVFESGQPVFVENTQKIKGRTVITETQKLPVFKNGQAVEIITIIQDVTEKKQDDEARKASEEKFKNLFEFAPDAFYLADSKGNTIDGNRAVEKLTGYSRDELNGKNFRNLKLLPPDQIPRAASFLAQTLIKGDIGPRELTLKRKDGSRVVVEIQTMTTKIRGKTQVLGLARDISHKKRIEIREKQLIRDLKFLNRAAMKFVNVTPEMDIFKVTAELLKKIVGHCVVVVTDYNQKNNALEVKAVAGLGKTKARIEKLLKTNIIGMKFPLNKSKNKAGIEKGLLAEIKENLCGLTFETIPEEVCRKVQKELGIRSIYAAGLTHSSRILGTVAILCQKNGKIHNFDLFNTFIKQSSGEIKRWLAERKDAASLHEKDVMLREIHHRVKNNMQIISSLLRLQAHTVRDKKAREKFTESQNRIRSMSLIHDNLYRSENFSLIDYGLYIRTLTSHLMSTQNIKGDRITLKVDADTIRLDINRAVPLGLIINELVTNALKHAFQGREKGRIAVSLSAQDNGELVLKVSDDGVGLPEGFDSHENGSLGLQLVKDLSAQLRGALRINPERCAGTSFELSFPLN